MRNFGCFFQDKRGVAFIEAHTDKSYTYAELDMMCDTVACQLSKTLKSGDRIAIAANNSVKYLALFFGAMRLGVCAVLIDHELPIDKQKELSNFANCVGFFDDHAIEECFDFKYIGDYIPVTPSDGMESYILFTSGSTGKPKGIVRTHRSNNFLVSYQRWSENGKKYMYASKLHLSGGIAQIMTCMGGAGTIVMLKKFTPKSYVAALTKYKVDAVNGFPAVLKLVMSTIKQHDIDVSFVSEVQTAGDVVTATLVNQINDVFNNPKFINRYSNSECPRPFINGSNKSYDFGFPHPDIEVKLVDGEFWYRGDITFKEYLNQPEETARVLENGWYKSNDIMRIDNEGRYWYVGRKDDVFMVMGYKVYPQEVSRLLEQHPFVSSAAVVPVPHRHHGWQQKFPYVGEGKVPVAFITVTKWVSEEDLRKFARENGPIYSHPRRIFFLDSLPLTASNKVDVPMLTHRAYVMLGGSL